MASCYNLTTKSVTCIGNGELLQSYQKLYHMHWKWSALLILQKSMSHALEMVS